MKKTLLTLVLANTLFMANDNNTTSLDMFLFKIGFKAMANDLDKQKEFSKNNEKRIQELESKIKSLLDLNSKQKIKNNILIKKVSTFEKIQENNITKPVISSTYSVSVVIANNAKIYSKPNSNSNLLKVINKHDIVKIQFCEQYGWCKIYNKDEYIAKYRLKF